MLNYLAIGVGAIVLLAGILVAWAATRPGEFRVRRSVLISAPPQAVFDLLLDLRRSPEWSAYETKDPDMKREYSGATSGVGAAYAWDGDRNVGAGRMEIIEAASPGLVRLRIEFFRPMRGVNTIDYVIEGDAAGSKVTTAMYGPNPLLAKMIGLLLNMDKMIGMDFELSLIGLKALSEKR